MDGDRRRFSAIVDNQLALYSGAHMSGIHFVVASLGLMFLVADVACGQNYPIKPVRVVVSAPGGGTDFVARLITQAISGPLDQQVIVEYRGIGFLAAEFVSKAAPD